MSKPEQLFYFTERTRSEERKGQNAKKERGGRETTVHVILSVL